MRLYESLVGNIGIGKKVVIQNWIDSKLKELWGVYTTDLSHLYADSVGISQKEGCSVIYFTPKDDTPDYVQFNKMRDLAIASNISNGPRPKYPEKYTPKYIGRLVVSGWDLRGQKLDFDCDGILMNKFSVRGFDEEMGVVVFLDNIWGSNTVINIKNGAFNPTSIFHLKPDTVIHTDTLILDTLNTTRYTSSKRVTEIVDNIVSKKNFPDLTTIYADNGVYTKSGNMWIFTKNR